MSALILLHSSWLQTVGAAAGGGVGGGGVAAGGGVSTVGAAGGAGDCGGYASDIMLNTLWKLRNILIVAAAILTLTII